MFGLYRKIKSWFVKPPINVTEVEYKLLKKYIKAKMRISRSMGYIGKISKETSYIASKHLHSPSLHQLKQRNIYYNKDTISVDGKSVQWDHQYDCITTFSKQGGDCNSINRIAQVWSELNGHRSYLVTYVSTNVVKNHTTCICKSPIDDKFYSFDYGLRGDSFNTLAEAVEDVAKKYDTKVITYVIQNIYWKIVSVP